MSFLLFFHMKIIKGRGGSKGNRRPMGPMGGLFGVGQSTARVINKEVCLIFHSLT